MELITNQASLLLLFRFEFFSQSTVPPSSVIFLYVRLTTNLFAEVLERRLEPVPELSLSLLGSQVVAVVQVLVLAEVSRDLAHLRVELNVHVTLLAEHDRVLRNRMYNACTDYVLHETKQ